MQKHSQTSFGNAYLKRLKLLKLYSLEIFTRLLIKVSKLRSLLTFNDHIEICSDVLGFSFLTTVQSSWD